MAISLAGLLIFPQVFLRSMGFGGMGAVLVAMVAALTLLPALLAMLGPQVDALSVRPGCAGCFRRAGRRAAGRGRPRRLGPDRAQRHAPPGRLRGRVTVALLLVLALPFLRVQFGGIDARALPAGTESRVVAETIDRGLPAERRPARSRPSSPCRTPSTPPPGGAALQSYVDAVADVPGVDGATVTGAAGDTARVGIAYDGDPIAAEARDAGQRVRAVPPPPGGEVLVGGQTAELADLLDSLGALLPWMALIVVGDDVRAAVPRLRLGRAAGQGDGDERAVAGRLVRRAGLDLPGRQPVRPARLHPDRASWRRPSRSWCWRSSSGCRWTTRSS